MYVFPEMVKNVQKMYQNLLFRQLTFQKTYILQCKMYVFDSGAPNLKFQSKIGKTYILQCKMYVFGILGLQNIANT